MKIAKSLSSFIKGEKHDFLQLDCMNNIGKYVTTFNSESLPSKWLTKVGRRALTLPSTDVYSVDLYSMKPFPVRLESAIIQEEDKYVVDLTKGLQHEMLRLEVGIRMNEEMLRSLVYHRSSREPLSDRETYHLQAQLTDPTSLSKGFSEVDVREYPVVAKVHIQQRIDAAFPFLKLYQKLNKIELEMLGDYDPRHGVRMKALQMERHRIRTKLKQQNPTRAIRELLLLLNPEGFLRYVHTSEEDFRLHECHWSAIELIERIGSISVPKAIDVVTRTDLTIKKPASTGKLLYESGKFADDIERISEK